MTQRRASQPVMTDEETKRCRNEAGSGGVFLVIMVTSLILIIGLTFDGGRILAERRQAIDVAQQAAIAGAQGVDLGQIRQGNVAINPARVEAAANAHLAATGYSGTVSVNGTEVIVVVTETVDMSILSAIGIGSKTVTGEGSARIVRGVEGADT